MASPTARLVVLNGPARGDAFLLDDPFPMVFGKRVGTALPEAALDAVHCQVLAVGGRWFVQDLGSPAGTFIGDERVKGVQPLEPGRSFRIGETLVGLIVGAPDELVTGSSELEAEILQALQAAKAKPRSVAAANKATSKQDARAANKATGKAAKAEAPRARAAKEEPEHDASKATGKAAKAEGAEGKKARATGKRSVAAGDGSTADAPPLPPKETKAEPEKAKAPRSLDSTDIFEIETPGEVVIDLEADAERIAAAEAAAAAAAASAPDLPALRAQDTLGDYDITKELGAGELGRVYKGFDRRRRRVVAIKVLDPALAKDPRVVARFLRGAQAGARLNHPNIVSILGAGHAGGRIYVTMEHVDGVDLGAACEAEGGRLPPRQAVQLLSKVVDALVYAHSKGVIHRHVSPRNILVGPGTTKLGDLALAKRAGDAKSPAVTRGDDVLTRSPYAAPEVVFDVQGVDHRADIFGVGATLFRVLTGRLPFEGSPVEALERLRDGRHEDPRKLVKGLSKELGAVLERCLKPDPADRYQAARELREALADLPETEET